MQAIKLISGLAMPLAKNDVDTDLIIPAQFLTQVSKQGYGEHCFQRLRENDPNFVMNLPQFAKANILISGDNFGCGSSREHAVWALQQAGIQAIIAQSFADIFANNSGKNALLLIEQPKEIIEVMLRNAADANYSLTIDVVNLKIETNRNEKFSFTMDSFQHYCLINGLDELDYLLAHQKEIKAFQERKHD